MMQVFRKGFLCLAMAGLCAISWTAQAQNTEPTPPPAPPAATAPPPVEVEAPATPPAPNVEAPDDNTQSTDSDDDSNRRDDRRPWRNRHRGGSDDHVAVGSNATLEKGRHADSVVSVFGSSTSDGDVSEAVVSVFGDTRVNGSSKDVVAVLGSVFLNGHASGDVVAVVGDVELGPQAVVDGELVVIGGTVKRDPAAVIHGNIQNVLGMSFGSFRWLRPWMEHCLIWLRPLAIADGLGWAWGLAFGFLGLYVLIAILFREPLERCVTVFEQQTGKTILAALITTILTPIVFGLLLITIIGIAFMPLLAIGLFLINIFGKAVLLTWIGQRVLKAAGQRDAQPLALAVLIGGLIVMVSYLIPFVGFVVYKTLGILGLGVAIYALLLAVKEKRAESNGTQFAAAGAAAGAGGTVFTDYSPSPPPPDYTVSSSGSARPFGSDRLEGPTLTGGSSSTAGSSSGPAGASSASSTQSAGYTGSASGTSSSQSAGYTGPTSGTSSSAPPPPPPPSPGATISPSAALSYPRAGFAVRMGALFIDLILVAVVLGIFQNHGKAELLALATYGAIMWKLKGTTIGGMVFHLQVVRTDGRPIDWATATVRALSCFLSLCVAGLGFIWIAFDDGRQAWHDKIAGTAVVRVPKGVSLL